ncbi:hypothetical protein D5086_002553 [Populus alba]|uniref:Uncharacterized protein n=1 Tax=Populus alba TaxID=43335 RepID=A0ACC4D2C4_POPAL
MQAIGSCPIKSVSVTHVLNSLLKSEGPAALYRGIAAMALGAGPAHAVHFSFYEVCKKHLSRDNPNSSIAHAVSLVFCATVASDAVFTPMGHGKAEIAIRETTVFDECTIYCGLFFTIYEAAKKGLMEISPDSVNDERWVVHATAGAAAGALAAAVTTPLDVVKNSIAVSVDIMRQPGVCGCDRFKSGSIGDVIRAILQKDGYRGLMRGWIPRMLFHSPAAAISWSTYEASKSFFHKLNSNSNSDNVT